MGDYMSRLAIHYVSAFVILTLYGGQVCPFVESLTLFQWGSETIVVFLISFIVNAIFYRKIKSRNPLVNITKITLGTFIIFIAGGFYLGIHNALIYDFPLSSGIKLSVGWMTVGFFMSLDIALYNRRKVILYLSSTGQHLELSKSYASLTKKFLTFTILTSFLVLSTTFLVIIKDLEWIIHSPAVTPAEMIPVLKEFAFIFIVFILYASEIAVSFTGILKMYLNHQNNALEEVMNGNLNVSVPVSSVDEFGHMAQYTNSMIKSLRERTEALQVTQEVSILSLTSLAETRDNETGAHIMRTQRYVKALAENLANEPDFADELTKENIDLIYKSAPLHDIGKVGIPDNILLKPGKLTDDEFKIMKRHPYYGKKSLETASNVLGKNSFLKYAEEIAFTHHEKWDGSGYPRRLSGQDIPLAGRIMALADVYDALISKRIYKPAFTHEKSKEIILDGEGKHFDPKIVKAFLNCEESFKEIAKKYSDENYKLEIKKNDT